MENLQQGAAGPKQSRLFLLAILLTNVVAMLNSTTVTISLPTYMSVFQVDINTVQWVVIGYMLPLGMMMPLSGYLCERYSYRKVFFDWGGGVGDLFPRLCLLHEFLYAGAVSFF